MSTRLEIYENERKKGRRRLKVELEGRTGVIVA